MKIEPGERAGELFDSGLYCAESVLKAIAEAGDIDSDIIPKIATGLCSGLSRTCRTCGAVSGAVMGISLVYGRNTPARDVEYVYALIQRFVDVFSKKFGSTNCRELTGCDLGTEEGQRYFEINHLKEKCREFTKEATKMAIHIMEEGV